MRQPHRFAHASAKSLKSSRRPLANFKGFCPVWIHESDYKFQLPLQSFPYSALHHSARETSYPGKKNWIDTFESSLAEKLQSPSQRPRAGLKQVESASSAF